MRPLRSTISYAVGRSNCFRNGAVEVVLIPGNHSPTTRACCSYSHSPLSYHSLVTERSPSLGSNATNRKVKNSSRKSTRYNFSGYCSFTAGTHHVRTAAA